MYKIIGADGREYGPVSLEAVQQWVRDRRADASTRVRLEGASEWSTLGQLPEFAEVLRATPPPIPPPPPASVAAASPQTDPGPSSLPSDVLERDYDLNLGDCLGRAWALVTGPKMGLVVGGVAILLAINFGLSMFGQIPFIGLLFALASLVIGPALEGGRYGYLLRCLRNEPVEIGNVFDGFRYCFGQLFLGTLVVGLLTIAALLPGGIAAGVGAFLASQHSAAPVAIALIAVGAVLMLVPAIYLSVCWAFTLPLIIDKRLEFWDAMRLSRAVVQKHWWLVFAFLLVSGLVIGCGVLACFVGLFFTLPLGTAAICYGYETLFSERPAQPSLSASKPIASPTL